MRTNLPDGFEPLIGRASDLLALGALTDTHRLVTIVGAGGVGKTRLAQALLRQRHDAFQHGVCWIELASVGSIGALPGAVATALGIDLGAGEPISALREATVSLSLLVVLDNAEHLVAGVAHLVHTLHDAAPDLRIIVTSQVPLQSAHEKVYRLTALQIPFERASAAEAIACGSVALFVERARAVDSRFVFDDGNATDVIGICRLLDGLPLAIELAAVRVSTLGVRRVLASLNERFELLTRSVARNVPSRQRTLRATLEWSHGLLEPREQRVFRRIAVMAGSGSLELVQDLAVDAGLASVGDDAMTRWEAVDALASLVDRSLVEVVQAHDRLVPLRYRLLDSSRAYALERLVEANEADAIRGRHAASMATCFDVAHAARWDGSLPVDRWMQAIEMDLDNAREAFAWARSRRDVAVALRIGATLMRALPRSVHEERCVLRDVCEALLDADVPGAVALRTWLAICDVGTGGQAQRMQDAACRACRAAREHGAAFDLYHALSHCAGARARLGDTAACGAYLAEMRTLEDAAWPPQRLGLGADAEYLCGRADASRVLDLTRRQTTINRAAGGNQFIAMANLVDAELGAGDARAAAETGVALLARLECTRDEHGKAYALVNLTAAWLELDETGRARAAASSGWPIGKRFELQPIWADYLSLLAALEARPWSAARLAGYSDARYVQHQDARQANEQRAHVRTIASATAVIGEAGFERARHQGRSLRDVDIDAVAFSTVDTAAAHST